MSFLPIDDPLYATIGNGAHVFALAGTLSFVILVALSFVRDETDPLFDPQWKKDGFCVTNPDVPYWNSHDMCLYVDSVSAVLLTLLYLALRKTPGLERANEVLLPAVVAIFVHGFGHGTVSKLMRDNNGEVAAAEDNRKTGLDLIEGLPPAEIFQLQLPNIIFWLGLVRAMAPNYGIFAVIVLALAAMLGQLFVPHFFAFTYVRTILMAIYSLNQLARKGFEKDFVYATYGMILFVPLTLVAWMESTQCSAFVREKLYGHLVYAGFMPFGLFTWYIICYLRLSLDDDVSQTLKKKDKDS